MRRQSILLFILLLVSFSLLVQCESNESVPINQKYAKMDRSIGLLQSSTADNPIDFHILFYGQSIIHGLGLDLMVNELQQKYPTANITFTNRSIRAFTVPHLIKTAEHDIYQDDPDLIIFHGYGGKANDVYGQLIRQIRSRIPADIMLLDHHYAWNSDPEELAKKSKRDSIDSHYIREIAELYDCEFVNVRKQWKSYLKRNDLGINMLMGDMVKSNVHPNDEGNKLLRQLIMECFDRPVAKDYVREADSLRQTIAFRAGEQPIDVNASRIDVIIENESSEITKIGVLVNNKKPSENRNNYFVTRATGLDKSERPAFCLVELGEPFPVVETWEVEIFDVDRDNGAYKFRVSGSKSGFDGEGKSDEDFLSNSGRIKIPKDHHNMLRIERMERRQMPEDFKVYFDVKSTATDTLVMSNGHFKFNVHRNKVAENTKLELFILEGTGGIKNIEIRRPYLSNE